MRQVAKDRLIFALDVSSRDEALALVNQLDGLVSFFKVGLQLFLAEGMSFVKELVRLKKRVFLDLKMNDVDETIKLAVREITPSGVQFLTIHGNGATATAAREGRGDSEYPKILSVTLLTSLDQQDLQNPQIVGTKGRKLKSLDDYVLWRAGQVVDAGCDGLIAAGSSVAAIRKAYGDKIIIVTPGIRPAGSGHDEHKRASTPKQAIEAGADFLVVGRPIRDASNPKAAAEAIVREIESASALAPA